MRVRIVTFGLGPRAEADYVHHAEQIAPSCLDWPGLLAKFWLADPGTHQYGGVYLFACAADAEQSRGTPLFGAMLANAAFEDVQVREFDVLDGPTATTAPDLAVATLPRRAPDPPAAVDDVRAADPQRVEAFAGVVLQALSGAATTSMIAIGDRLGLYRCLAEDGAATSDELADRAGAAGRYVREWLAQQTAAGIVRHEAGSGRFRLPAEHAAVLADETSPAYLVGGALLSTGWAASLERVVDAARSGCGIPWEEQHPFVFEGTERLFAPGYRTSFVADWSPRLDHVHDVLRTGGSVADVGCGHGVSSILLAEAYPASSVTGYDAHPPSIARARSLAAAAGLDSRVRFEVATADSLPSTGHDLVCFLDTLHDVGDPAAAVRQAWHAPRPGGRCSSWSHRPTTTSTRTPRVPPRRSATRPPCSSACRRRSPNRVDEPSEHRPVPPRSARSSRRRVSPRSGGSPTLR